MNCEDVERGQRVWLAMRRAGEGSEEWRQAVDHWLAWAREHGVELMNLAAEYAGFAPLVDVPQTVITVRAAPMHPGWEAAREKAD